MDEYNGLIPEDEIEELDPAELEAIPRDAELPANDEVESPPTGQSTQEES
jgi:hypothetical protein